MNLRDDEAEEMGKLRSGSVSPSTLSTASSGSPLVRGSSSSSAGFKRPAPTSIAAAQLLCQQQRQNQLEFTNKLAPDSCGSTIPQVATNQSKSNWNSKSTAVSSGSEEKRRNKKVDKVSAKSNQQNDDNNKSLGYNLAKSIAFRAYRFNEFWSVNKMKYLNLACLLMTLICLVTILCYGTSNNSNNNGADLLMTNKAKLSDENGEMGEETIDSLDSQPLVNSRAQRANSENGLFDEINSSLSSDEDSNGTGRFRLRKIDTLANEVKASSSSPSNMMDNEREIEDNKPSSVSFESPDSILSPILKQIFNEMDLGKLFKSIRRSTLNESSIKPIIRRGKNGATIIISSRSFNESSLNDTNLPSLFEKLIPPMMRPLTLPRRPSDINGNPGLATATITIGAEPLIESSSISRLNPFGFPLDPFVSSPFRGASLFSMMEPPQSPISFRMGPFGPAPFGQSSMISARQPSLLSMIVRASQPELEENLKTISPKNMNSSEDKEAKNETLSAQASQNSTTTVPLKPEILKSNSALDPDVELFDVSHLPRSNSRQLHNFYSRNFKPIMPQSGSMLIVSSSAGQQPEASFQMPSHPVMGGPPFMGPMVMPNGPMMFINGNPISESQAPLNPVLRSILSNVVSDLQNSIGSSDVDSSKNNNNNRLPTDRKITSSKAQQSSILSPIWTSWPQSSNQDSAEEENQDRWDEAISVKPSHRGARHKDEDIESASETTAEFVNGIQFDQSSPNPSMEAPGIITGTIRQTIRGPGGMTVERIIEVPPSRAQQVAPGVKSQSLSRTSVESIEEPFISMPSHLINSGPLVSTRHRASDRSSGEDFPLQFGLIGKLLSDISQRADRNGASVIMRNRASSSDEDLDEGDSIQEESSQIQRQPPGSQWGPRVRVASARIRMRPLLEPRFSNLPQDAIFMPAHFSLTEMEDKEGERESSNEHIISGSVQENKPTSFEDTLNSMEDRLNHVLSMTSQNSFGGGAQGLKQITNDEEQQSITSMKGSNMNKLSGDTQVERNEIPMRQQVAKLDEQSQIKESNQLVHENPFTSPTSPLFGFPTSSLAQSSSANNEQVAKIKPVVVNGSSTSSLLSSPSASTSAVASSSSNNNNNGFQRQPRAFTYHSNNEIAQSVSMQKADQLNGADSQSRPKFMAPLLPPPASIVMGRRLDEETSFEASQEQHQQQPLASHSNFIGGQAAGLHGRAMASAGKRQLVLDDSYRNIVARDSTLSKA